MKQFADAQRVMMLLERRALTLRRQTQRQREALRDAERKVDEMRQEIGRLEAEIKKGAQGGQFSRPQLMRLRGTQAVLRFAVACKRMDEVDLLEQRGQIEQELQASRKAALALEQRQDKHRHWLARRRLEYDLMRELLAETEMLEGRVHVNQR